MVRVVGRVEWSVVEVRNNSRRNRRRRGSIVTMTSPRSRRLRRDVVGVGGEPGHHGAKRLNAV